LPGHDHCALDAGRLALLARQLYVEGPYLMRKMMHYRIRICPFELLIPVVSPGASVLDVGCGSGLFLALLAGSVPDLTGVGFDSSRLAIETALRMAEQAKHLGLQAALHFVRLDVADPWPGGLFDVVSLVDVLHHIPPAHQRSVFNRATESVKAGGMLLYKDMANHPVFHASMNRLHDLLLARQWIHYVPISRVDQWARELGFGPTHCETVSRFWYRHDLRVYRKAAEPVA
jgi:cyclopropane fatty-acyl-phospholipid synthase-like methyltransferase